MASVGASRASGRSSIRISTFAVISGRSRSLSRAVTSILTSNVTTLETFTPRGEIRTTSPANSRLRIGVDGDLDPLPGAHLADVALVDRGEHEDAREIRDDEGRRAAADVADPRGDDLPDLHGALRDHPVDRRDDPGFGEPLARQIEADLVVVDLGLRDADLLARLLQRARLVLELLDAGARRSRLRRRPGRRWSRRSPPPRGSRASCRAVRACGRPWRGRPARGPGPRSGRRRRAAGRS